MTRLAKFGVALLAALIIEPAAAQVTTQTDLHLVRVGAQGNAGYLSFSNPLVENCSWGNVYFALDTDAGRSYFSLATSAYLAGKSISRLDYSIAATGQCTVTLLEI